MTEKILRLKALAKDKEYDPEFCAVARCRNRSMVIDGTHKLSKEKVPLCETHWVIRADM